MSLLVVFTNLEHLLRELFTFLDVSVVATDLAVDKFNRLLNRRLGSTNSLKNTLGVARKDITGLQQVSRVLDGDAVNLNLTVSDELRSLSGGGGKHRSEQSGIQTLLETGVSLKRKGCGRCIFSRCC